MTGPTRSMVLLALVAVAGCSSHIRLRRPADPGLAWSYRATAWPAAFTTPADPPPPALEDDEVEQELALQARRRELERRALLRAVVREAAAQAEVADAAAAVRACYAAGARDLADRLIDGHPDVYRWDEAGQVVEVSATYLADGGGGFMDLALALREGQGPGPLAVCFPPGTYGEAAPGPAGDDRPLWLASERPGPPWVDPREERRWGEWPPVQDLAFLQAPVVVLDRTRPRAHLRVPVACASFERPGPRAGQPFALRSFERGSLADALLVALCAGPDAPEAAAQVAVWVARDDISWQDFLAGGGAAGVIVTFGSGLPIRADDARGAARLLLRGGIDPRATRLFGGAARSVPDAGALPPAAEPDPPAPAPPAPGSTESPPVADLS